MTALTELWTDLLASELTVRSLSPETGVPCVKYRAERRMTLGELRANQRQKLFYVEALAGGRGARIIQKTAHNLKGAKSGA